MVAAYAITFQFWKKTGRVPTTKGVEEERLDV
jgi:hypothetical protein